MTDDRAWRTRQAPGHPGAQHWRRGALLPGLL